MHYLVNLLEELQRSLLIRPLLHFRAWRCERMKRYLLLHDYNYRDNYIGMEIVRQRERLRDDHGNFPSGVRIPDRSSVEAELPRKRRWWLDREPFGNM